MREVIMTGKTVEEATAAALAELGLSEDEVTVEVIDLPQKKFFKTIPAKVKVTADADEEIIAVEKPVAPVAAPKAEKPAAPAPKKTSAEKPAQAETAQKDEKTEKEVLEEKAIDLAENEKARDAVAYLTDICGKMGCGSVTVTAVMQGEAIILKVDGTDAGSLIGHRGEVMEALSYLTSLVANRNGGDYAKIGLDINHYRSKREGNLTALAKRIGAKVVKTGRAQTLEPMNPYERRIIHSAIGEMEGVKSESTGEGTNRRVVIMSTDPNAKNDRPFRQAGRGNRGGNRSGSRSGNADRAPRAPRRDGDFAPKSNVPARNFADKPRDASAAPIVPKRTETINDGGDLPLYGKIEL